MTNENNIGNSLDIFIKNKVKEICSQKQIPENKELIKTDNFGEVIDKLIIAHIRMWMLEDSITPEKSDTEIAQTKRKIDVCFKSKRPMFIEAINKMVDDAIINGKSLTEESVKLYKGQENV